MMSKAKYLYAVVDKEDGSFPNNDQLPIFRRKAIALGCRQSLGYRFVVQKIEPSDLENLILKSKKA